MTHQIVLYVAGMAWGVIVGLWLAWIWGHQNTPPNLSQEGNTPPYAPLKGGIEEGDVEEQRRNRAEMAAQPENRARIAKAVLRAMQKDRDAMFVLMGFGNSQSDLCHPRRMRRES
jgi:hypothetical protein